MFYFCTVKQGAVLGHEYSSISYIVFMFLLRENLNLSYCVWWNYSLISYDISVSKMISSGWCSNHAKDIGVFLLNTLMCRMALGLPSSFQWILLSIKLPIYINPVPLYRKHGTLLICPHNLFMAWCKGIITIYKYNVFLILVTKLWNLMVERWR